MMRAMFGLRLRPFLAATVLILAVGAVVWLGLASNLRVWLEDRVEEELLVRVEAAARLLPTQLGDPDAAVDDVGALLDARVTLVAPSGVVLGDSERTAAAVVAMDNHALRPEIVAAGEAGTGVARRLSTTLETEMLYVAKARRLGGWVRVAMPLSRVDETLLRLRTIGLVALLVALVAGLLGTALNGVLITQSLSRGLQAVRRHLGDVEPSETIEGSVSRMGRELNRLVADLGASRDQLRTVLETMEAGVVALDGAGKILALNSTAREILAVADKAGAAPSSELLQRLPGLVDRDIPDAESTFGFRAGSPRIVSVHAGDASDGSRVVVLQDITEQRRAETIRRDFVANASHELRTPVAVMQANAETLLAGALDDKAAARGFVEGMHRHAHRLSALLADLLDLSRIEAGRYALDLKTLDVNEAFLRARDTVSGRAQDEGVTVLQTADDALVVLGDARALDQVLVNLLDNAIKYSRTGSTVELVGEDTPAGVRLQVRDQGPGIPEEHRARLFERFYRVDPGRDRRFGGTGLGLAIVKHLGAAMGGAVGMHPNESVGSVFWISLPRP